MGDSDGEILLRLTDDGSLDDKRRGCFLKLYRNCFHRLQSANDINTGRSMLPLPNDRNSEPRHVCELQ